jgi:hypothetical protein
LYKSALVHPNLRESAWCCCRSMLICPDMLRICTNPSNMHCFFQICPNLHGVVADLCWSALWCCRSSLILAVMCKYALVSAYRL